MRFIVLSAAILGGLQGIVITLRLFFRDGSQGSLAFFLLGWVLIGYAFVTVAGLVFWRQPKRIRPMRWAQAIQVPWISMPGVVYKFAAGLTGAVAFVFSHTGEKYAAGYETSWKLGSSCKLSLLLNAPLELGINVAPLAVLFLLREIQREASRERPVVG